MTSLICHLGADRRLLATDYSVARHSWLRTHGRDIEKAPAAPWPCNSDHIELGLVLDFSEDDHVSAVVDAIRNIASQDILLEKIVIGTRKRMDIAIRGANGKIKHIIEVKRPEEFRTEQQRDAASEQVRNYAVQQECESVGWTDGRHYFCEDLATGEASHLLLTKAAANGQFGPARRGFMSQSRPGFSVEDLVSFPLRQRRLTPPYVKAVEYVRRSLPDFSFDAFLVGTHPLQIVSGESDIGKSTLAQELAADPRWNALFLDGVTLVAGVDDRIREDIQTIYGQALPNIWSFIDDVAEFSQQELAVPFGAVIDGFDEWYSLDGSSLAALNTFVERVRTVGGHVLLFTRPNEQRTLERSRIVSSLSSPDRVITLGLLTEEELDRFVATYFEVHQIGGALLGNAREICRSPAILAMVAETYEGQPTVDPGLTQPELYRRYMRHKLGKMADRSRSSEDRFATAVDNVALKMLRDDKFTLLRSEVVAITGDQVCARLIDEGILWSANPEPGDRFLRFRFGQLRDHLITKLAERQGMSVSDLMVRRARGQSPHHG